MLLLKIPLQIPVSQKTFLETLQQEKETQYWYVLRSWHVFKLDLVIKNCQGETDKKINFFTAVSALDVWMNTKKQNTGKNLLLK